jgi:hypothetical protein
MSFSEKLRDGIGQDGARVEVGAIEAPVAAGSRARAQVTIVSGGKPAAVEAVIARLVEADRHWTDRSGARVLESEAQARADRRDLTAGWERRTIAEAKVSVGRTLEPGERCSVELEIDVPAGTKPSSAACTHTLAVQADVKGQIDPSANTKLLVTE